MAHHRLLPALTVLLLALVAAPARAETVKLRSGRVLQVSAVRVLDSALAVTLRVEGGTARVDLRFDRLDPRDLLRLLDRHAAAEGGKTRLRTARLALGFGLRAEAARRFTEAAELEEGLAGERDAGLATLRTLEIADALLDLEMRLRRGADPQGAFTRATSLLEGPHRDALTPVQVQRVRALAGLARAALQRCVAPPAPAAAPAAPPPSAAHAGLARVHALAVKALHARESAADPGLRAPQALRHLETAARALLDGRRLLRDLPTAIQQDAAPGEVTLRALLVATYLDLAEIHRQAGRLDETRAHLRATLILDPGNEAAWSLRLLVEEDLRRGSWDAFDPYGPVVYDLFFPAVHPGTFLGQRFVSRRLGRSGHRHARCGGRGSPGPRRVVGSRRSR